MPIIACNREGKDCLLNWTGLFFTGGIVLYVAIEIYKAIDDKTYSEKHAQDAAENKPICRFKQVRAQEDSQIAAIDFKESGLGKGQIEPD